MKFIADLHVHSHFSRATSRTLDPEHLSLWAQKKGITVVGTGDFTHPGWVSELRDKLIETEPGLYGLKPAVREKITSQVPLSCHSPTRFLLSGEISCIYKKNGKTRKVHHLILMPDMASVSRLNDRLDQIGNITSDGRPILGLDSRDLLEIILEVTEDAFFIPAHIWTPWFSVFGSKSGFDSLEECFEDLTGYIHALETGLSSDPSMNRLISALDDYLLVSNSDAHSPQKLGREANIFDTDLDYNSIIHSMTDGRGFNGTVEFYPEEGKYHLDGHRKCKVRLQPEETEACQGICPVCGRPLTFGVLNRIHELSDRDTPSRLSKDFFSLIPLTEILSEIFNCGPATKKVMSHYEMLLLELGPEIRILMDISLSDIEASGGPVLSEAIKRMRNNQVIRHGGYDGEYGKIHLFGDFEKETIAGQMALFDKKVSTCRKQPSPAPRRNKRGYKKKKEVLNETALITDSILDPLNPEQRQVVLHKDGNLLVVAGPGTGKTRALSHRIAYLVCSGPAKPEEILALTFTRKASMEMKQRVSGLLQGLVPAHIRIYTFHRFCLEVLRNHGHKTGLSDNFTLFSEIDAENLKKEILAESGADKSTIQAFLKALPGIKKAGVIRDSNEVFDHDLYTLFEKYQLSLKELGMMDLDDLEVEALRLFQENPELSAEYGNKYPWVFVDEYQDTNAVQVELLKKLIHSSAATICAIGDPNQAIYGFRGADIKNFYRFAEDFPVAKEVMLTRNYRSTRFILKGSAAVIGKAKSLECESSSGGDFISLAPCYTESEEAEMIVEVIEKLIGGTSYFSLDTGRAASHDGKSELGFDDIGVLYRLNAQGDAIEKALSRAGLPFVRSGETPLIHQFPIDIIWRFFQTLCCRNNPFYEKMYARLISDHNLRKREVQGTFQADASVSQLIDRAVAFHELDCSSREAQEVLQRLRWLADDFEGDMSLFLDSLSLERGIDHTVVAGDRLSLMSLHAAKGLEWPVVFITGCEDQLIPCSLFGSKDEQEERRLLYVGMTRARSRLILSHVRQRMFNGRVLKMQPSPFLDAIPQEICSPVERQWKRRARSHRQLNLFE